MSYSVSCVIFSFFPAAPVGVSRDWNNALVVMTTIGHVLVYSIPDIKLIYHKELYVLPSDQK